ncbi:unnamed protein product [Ectocarpus sp. 8 AP-2014]
MHVQFPAGKMPSHQDLTCCRRLRLPQQNKTRAVTLRNQPPSVPGQSNQAPSSARSVHASTCTRNYPFVGRCSCCWPGWSVPRLASLNFRGGGGGGGGRRQPRLSSCRLGRGGADRRSVVPHHAEAYPSREGRAAGHRATSGAYGGVSLAWCRRSRRRNAWGQAKVNRRSADRLLLLAILRKRMRPGTTSRQTHVLTSRRRAAHRRKHLKSH